MDTLDLRIAGHNLTIKGYPEAELLISVPGFPVFVHQPSQSAEYAIRFVEALSIPSTLHSLTSFPFDSGEAQCFLGRHEDCLILQMVPQRGQEMVLEHRLGTNIVEATHSSNINLLRFGCWFAFAMLIGQELSAPIHSSTIVYHDRAVLFLGESGTGKSTHTRLWLDNVPGARLLNDDSPILSTTQSGPVVSGSPWSGKTHCYHNEQYPLAAIVRLSQAPQNIIRKLSVIEAFAAIQPSLPPALAIVDYYADRWVDIVAGVLESVPVFHLACLPNAEAAALSCYSVYVR